MLEQAVAAWWERRRLGGSGEERAWACGLQWPVEAGWVWGYMEATGDCMDVEGVKAGGLGGAG